MIDEPGLRPYTLMEAYETFGSRSYTNVRRKELDRILVFRASDGWEAWQQSRDMIINGILISSGEIKVRIARAMGYDGHAHVTLETLAQDFEWPDGSPCGVVEG